MKEHQKDNFELIEGLLNNTLKGEELNETLTRLRDDHDFYVDFQLWVNLDEWIIGLPEHELATALAEPQKTETSRLGNIVKYWKRISSIKPNISTVLSVAASLFIVVGGIVTYYKFFSKAETITVGNIKYREIGNDMKGHGAFDQGGKSDKIPFKLKPFAVQADFQLDTTYIFQYEPEFKLVFKAPFVNKEFGKGFRLEYNYNTQKFTLFTGSNTYILQQTSEWKKLAK